MTPRTTCPVCTERHVQLVHQIRVLSDLIAAWGQCEELSVAVEALGRFLGNVADEIERSCLIPDDE